MVGWCQVRLHYAYHFLVDILRSCGRLVTAVQIRRQTECGSHPCWACGAGPQPAERKFVDVDHGEPTNLQFTTASLSWNKKSEAQGHGQASSRQPNVEATGRVGGSSEENTHYDGDLGTTRGLIVKFSALLNCCLHLCDPKLMACSSSSPVSLTLSS